MADGRYECLTCGTVLGYRSKEGHNPAHDVVYQRYG